MGAFKKVERKDQLLLKQRGGAVVFLESQDDYEIIAKRWFFDCVQDISFEPADQYETDTGGGGCRAVIDLVKGMRSEGISAFGLVDRDVLLNDHNWELWRLEEDAEFLDERPYGQWIRVLLRWELENYLLDPDAMAHVANNAPTMTSTNNPDNIATACLACADGLKEKSAATVAAVAAKKSGPAPGFGCGKPPKRMPSLRADLVAHLGAIGIANAAVEMQRQRPEIDRFDEPGGTPQRRWERLTRMLDGKAALQYLSCCTPTRFDNHRGFLANRMREVSRIPDEIQGYIKEFQAAVV